MNESSPKEPRTRSEQKQRTRHALMNAALRLLEDQSFDGLSLREVTREAGIVPTAFYRHFRTMDELGLALIDDSFRALRGMLREARADPSAPDDAIRTSVATLARHVHAHKLHFRFIVRERSSGVSVLRRAIRDEIRLFASELATDLARFPYLERWSTEDLNMIAGLIVGSMVSTAEALIEVEPGSPEEAEIVRVAGKQLRLVVLGVPAWEAGPG